MDYHDSRVQPTGKVLAIEAFRRVARRGCPSVGLGLHKRRAQEPVSAVRGGARAHDHAMYWTASRHTESKQMERGMV